MFRAFSRNINSKSKAIIILKKDPGSWTKNQEKTFQNLISELEKQQNAISDEIDKIEDVNYFQKGIFGAFFNFGNVLIQTAAELTEFVFNNVPNPDRVVKIISELIGEEEQEQLEGRVR